MWIKAPMPPTGELPVNDPMPSPRWTKAVGTKSKATIKGHTNKVGHYERVHLPNYENIGWFLSGRPKKKLPRRHATYLGVPS